MIFLITKFFIVANLQLLAFGHDGNNIQAVMANSSNPIAIQSSNYNDYFVSVSGDDNYSGLSPELAWKTIAKVNSHSFVPGDRIHFKRGDEWREKLIIGQSGTVNAKITFTAYGTGAKPIINGSDILLGWGDCYNNIDRNIWGTVDPSRSKRFSLVVIDDILYREVGSLAEVVSQGTYWINTGSEPDSIYVWSATDPDKTVAEVSARDYCIYSVDQQYVTLSYLDVRNAGADGIRLVSNNGIDGYCIVDSVNAYRNRLSGIAIYNGHRHDLITNCVTTYNGFGILGWEDVDYMTVSHCYSAHSILNNIGNPGGGTWTDATGFQFYCSDNVVVEYCESSADPIGIFLDPFDPYTGEGVAHDNIMTARYNYVHDAPQGNELVMGIGVTSLAAGGVINIYYNLIKNCANSNNGSIHLYGPYAGALNVYNNTIISNEPSQNAACVLIGHSANAVFKNNIYYYDADANHEPNYAFIATQNEVFTSDYNQYFETNALDTRFLNYHNVPYKVLATWQAAIGQDSHSQIGNPLFVNVLSDWSLQANSPCINKGTIITGIPQKDILGHPIIGLPDMGCFEKQIGAYAPAPVYLSSVIENASPTLLELIYDLDLAVIVPNTSAFVVQVNTVDRNINVITVSGTKVLLTLASPVVYGDLVTVSYTKPSTNPIQTTAGGQAVAISAQNVSNRVAALIPVYVSASVENATPLRLEMTYNLSLANIIPTATAFAVLVNSVARAVSFVTISGTKVFLTLTSPVVYGDAITIAYTKPSSNPLQTSAGGQAGSISPQAVTNKVATIELPVYSGSAIENATPLRLEMTYNLSLANIIPAVSAFVVTVNSAIRTVSSIAISGPKVFLTLASPVMYGDVVTIAYTKPSSNPLQTAAGGQAVSIIPQSVTNKVASPALPVYSGSAIENATPLRLEMTYNLTLANIIPSASAFVVVVNSTIRTVSSVAISGTKVYLTLSSPVVYSDVVTIAYTKPSLNPLQTTAGGQASTIGTQTVKNHVTHVNVAPVIIVTSTPRSYSGFVSAVSAEESYDPNQDNLTFTWSAPANVSVSSTSGATIKFLGPNVSVPTTVEFTISVSDGKTSQLKVIPVEILPYKPELETAEVVKVYASSYHTINYPYNIIDGNIGTLWSAEGTDQWLVTEMKDLFNIQHVKLAFQPGQRRESYFDVLGSNDNETWEPILSKSVSCDFSGEPQVFDFPLSKTGKEFKFVKLAGKGNSTDTWNYISELKIYGYRHGNPQYYEKLAVKIYPNPASEIITIRIDEPTLSSDFIRIISLSGEVVFHEKVNPDIREFKIPIKFKQGLYIVQLQSNYVTLFAQKLIIRN